MDELAASIFGVLTVIVGHLTAQASQKAAAAAAEVDAALAVRIHGPTCATGRMNS
jgi:hypothetical protein